MANPRSKKSTPKADPPPDEYDSDELPDSGPKYKVLFKVTSAQKANAMKEVLMLYNPAVPPSHGQMVAKALHKPQQVMGWDPVEYGFHWTDRYTTQQLVAYKNRKRAENSNYFPRWSVDKDRDCPNNAFLYKEMEDEWNAFAKGCNVGKMRNSFDGDNPTPCFPFGVWGVDLAGGLYFMRNLKFEHPKKSNQDCWDLGIKLLQSEVNCKSDLQNYWSRHLKTEQYKKALNRMQRLKTINTNPETKIPIMNEIMIGLGIRTLKDPRKSFERLQQWAKAVPTSDQVTRKKVSFLAKLTLDELPEEAAKKAAEDQAKLEKETKEKEKELAKKMKLHCRPDNPLDGDTYYNEDGVMVTFMDGKEILEENMKLPYIPASKRKASMCSKPEHPSVGDLFYDEVGNLVRQDVEDDESGYVVVDEDDDIDVTKIIGKAPAKKIQPTATKPAHKRKKKAAPANATTNNTTRESSRGKRQKYGVEHHTFWDASIEKVVIDVDKIGDIVVESEELSTKKEELTKELSSIAQQFERQQEKTSNVIKVGKTPKGKLCFECEDEEWKKFNNWLVDKIIMVMNDLSTSFGVKFDTGKWKLKHKMAMTCAAKCGFIPEEEHKNIQSKEELEKWAEAWLHPFNCGGFYDRLAALENWIGPTFTGNAVSSVRYGLVLLAVDRLGLTDEEKSTVLTVFIEIAAWP